MKSFLWFDKKYWLFLIAILLIVRFFVYSNFSFFEQFDTHPTLDNIHSSNNYDMKKTHGTCKDLSNHACNNASFCVLLDGERCVGGNKKGPTYLTEDGKDVDYKYYNYRGACSGTCPSDRVK